MHHRFLAIIASTPVAKPEGCKNLCSGRGLGHKRKWPHNHFEILTLSPLAIKKQRQCGVNAAAATMQWHRSKANVGKWQLLQISREKEATVQRGSSNWELISMAVCGRDHSSMGKETSDRLTGQEKRAQIYKKNSCWLTDRRRQNAQIFENFLGEWLTDRPRKKSSD